MFQDELPKPNKTCVVCGKKYYACDHCIKNRMYGMYSYKLTCCSQECFVEYMNIVEAQKEAEELALKEKLEITDGHCKQESSVDNTILNKRGNKRKNNILKAKKILEKSSRKDEM